MRRSGYTVATGGSAGTNDAMATRGTIAAMKRQDPDHRIRRVMPFGAMTRPFGVSTQGSPPSFDHMASASTNAKTECSG